MDHKSKALHGLFTPASLAEATQIVQDFQRLLHLVALQNGAHVLIRRPCDVVACPVVVAAGRYLWVRPKLVVCAPTHSTILI